MRRGRSWLRVSAVASLAFTVAGCSYFMVDGPPKNYGSLETFECTEHSQAPWIDAVLAVAGAVGFVTGFYAEGNDDWPWAHAGYAGMVVLPAAGVSSILGFRRVSRCRGAKRDLRERLGEVVSRRNHR